LDTSIGSRQLVFGSAQKKGKTGVTKNRGQSNDDGGPGKRKLERNWKVRGSKATKRGEKLQPKQTGRIVLL